MSREVSPQRLAEVEDFVNFLRTHIHKQKSTAA
jgi:hypothetical protein